MSVVVLDVGKTKLKASLIADNGDILRSCGTQNGTIEHNGYLVQDLAAAWEFMFQSLCQLTETEDVSDVIVSTHGSSGMIVNTDGTTTPLPDYESTMPSELDARYAEVADDLEERGANNGPGGAHLAKQLFWIQLKQPELFRKAEAVLPAPQYWAWRLSGVMSMDLTSLTAQSHLWNAREHRFTRLVARQGWERLMAPVRNSSFVLGTIAESLVARCPRLKGIRVRCGVHDSAANFHRYQSSGFRDFTLLSCGTWLVGLSDIPFHTIPQSIDVTFQQSALGVPLTSCRAMAGREFEILTHGRHDTAPTDAVNAILTKKTYALPSFVRRGGLVAGAGHKGRIVGSAPVEPIERIALAVVYYSMLADLCAEYLGDPRSIIVDGNVTAQPALGSLLAGLDPDRKVLISSSENGTAAGAALLAGIAQPRSSQFLEPTCNGLNLTALGEYHRDWRAQIDQIQNNGDAK